MESQIIEYKQSWRDEFLKEICGFVNAQGGTLYIGVDDKGNAVGLQHAKKLLEDIPNQSVMTMGVMPNVNLLNKDGKEYLIPCIDEVVISVDIDAEKIIIRALKGIFEDEN